MDKHHYLDSVTVESFFNITISGPHFHLYVTSARFYTACKLLYFSSRGQELLD